MTSTSLPYERPSIQKWTAADAFFSLFGAKSPSSQTDKDWRVARIQEFIDSQSSKGRMSVELVCKHLGLPLSGRQARRKFVACTGIGIREYSKKRRLVSAAEQLKRTNAPIKAIAADAGYHSSCHFGRSFKKMFHVSPAEFRRKWR